MCGKCKKNILLLLAEHRSDRGDELPEELLDEGRQAYPRRELGQQLVSRCPDIGVQGQRHDWFLSRLSHA